MAIITVARRLACLGDEVALEISRILAIPLAGKDELDERIKNSGAKPDAFKNSEGPKGGFFAALSKGRDDYLHYLKTALLETARDNEPNGGCVILGRGGQAEFATFPTAVSIYLTSPYDERIARVKNYFRCNDKRAEQIIEKSDRDRADFYRYFFEQDWTDSSHYTMCFNTARMTPQLCASIVKAYIDGAVTPEREAQTKRQIDEMLLAQSVIRHIQFDKGVMVRFLDARVDGSTVSLYGVTVSPAIVETAKAAAREVEGVGDVISDIQVVEDYNTQTY
jgi:hypothetical protein